MHLETYLTFEGNCREAEEKELIMPMQDQFWGAYFGRLTDKFGINWMISFDATEQQ